jgi:hypothetical protein
MAEQPGIPEGLIDEFLAHLARRGRGSYTAQSYRLGLRDFARWLTAAGRRLDEVAQRDIESYVDEFARGAKSGARRPDPRRAGVVDLATRQESGPQWLLIAKDVIEAAGGLAALVSLLAPQVTKAVNLLRRNARKPPNVQSGLPETRSIQLEFHSREGMTVAATIPVDGPLEDVERLTSALVAAFDRPRELVDASRPLRRL